MSEGIQDNKTLSIDMVYTRLGRFYKANDNEKARITKFALSDDGIDYRLFRENLPDDQQDQLISAIPQLSVFTDEGSLMKNKLISFSLDTEETSTMSLTPTQILITPDYTRSSQTIRVTGNIIVDFPSPNGFNVMLKSRQYVYLNQIPTIQETVRPYYLSRSTGFRVDYDRSLLQPASDVTETGGFVDPADRQTSIDGIVREGDYDPSLINPTRLDILRRRYPDLELVNNETTNKRVQPSDESQTIRVAGLNNDSGGNFTFDVIYNTGYSFLGENTLTNDFNGEYKTKVQVESIDHGITREVDVLISQ